MHGRISCDVAVYIDLSQTGLPLEGKAVYTNLCLKTIHFLLDNGSKRERNYASRVAVALTLQTTSLTLLNSDFERTC